MRAGDERRRETGVERARACAWLAMRCWAARAGQGSPRCVLRRRALGVPAACTTVLRRCAGAPADVPGGRLQCCCVAYASLCSVRALQFVRVHSSSAARRAGVGHPCRGRGSCAGRTRAHRARGGDGGRRAPISRAQSDGCLPPGSCRRLVPLMAARRGDIAVAGLLRSYFDACAVRACCCSSPPCGTSPAPAST